MHRVASTGNAANAARPQRERKLTYLIRDSDDSRHCSTVNCLSTCSSPPHDSSAQDVLFTGSRDGTLKRWELSRETAACCATFESHTDWVNDAVLMGDTLVSCSSDSTIKTWQAFSNGTCTKTLRQHSDYVLSLAVAKHTNAVASGGLGGEVFVWDLEAANVPVAKSIHKVSSNIKVENSIGPVRTSGQMADDEGTVSPNNKAESQSFKPIAAKGHKESVYAVAMNDNGTVLVSGGTEKALRVWDPRSGSKSMKLRGHSDNIRALALDYSGRFCLSGSSDSMIRLWDLGQQRCLHSYAVHTDSVWALQANTSFTSVYSGGRDSSVYRTDLNSRESSLVCSEQHPVLALTQDGFGCLWVAPSDSPVHKWPTTSRNQKPSASAFVAGTLPFARARACMEGLPPIPISSEPLCVIPVSPSIVRHAVLNDKRCILTKDTAGFVKLWEITKGAVKSDFGKVSFEDKEKELFEMVSVPAWFTADIRLGCLSIHLETPQCFSAEMYAVDVPIAGASEEMKVNLGQETLRGLFSHWLACRELKKHSVSSGNGDVAIGSDVENGSGKGTASNGSLLGEETHKGGNCVFKCSSIHLMSIVTEDLQGGIQRRKLIDLDGTEDEKELPTWCLDCLLHGKISAKENTKCSFYLHPYEGTTIKLPALGKLSAPRILRIHKVITYVLEKMVLDKPSEEGSSGATAGNNGQLQTTLNGKVFRTGTRYWQQKKKFSVDIFCNNQVLRSELSLATVRQYIWKKPEDLYLYYRVTQEQ